MPAGTTRVRDNCCTQSCRSGAGMCLPRTVGTSVAPRRRLPESTPRYKCTLCPPPKETTVNAVDMVHRRWHQEHPSIPRVRMGCTERCLCLPYTGPEDTAYTPRCADRTPGCIDTRLPNDSRRVPTSCGDMAYTIWRPAPRGCLRHIQGMKRFLPHFCTFPLRTPRTGRRLVLCIRHRRCNP
jgi:hypothetical protein